MTDKSNKVDKENILGIKVENFGECAWCKKEDTEEQLIIPFDIWTKWLHVSWCMNDKEWGANFVVEDGIITDWNIPKQEVTGSSCEIDPAETGKNHMHSHHSMGAFWSGQDDTASRNLHEYSIVWSTKGYKACRRMKLPCGGWGYKDVELIIPDEPALGMDNIEEVTYVVKAKETKTDYPKYPTYTNPYGQYGATQRSLYNWDRDEKEDKKVDKREKKDSDLELGDDDVFLWFCERCLHQWIEGPEDMYPTCCPSCMSTHIDNATDQQDLLAKVDVCAMSTRGGLI